MISDQTASAAQPLRERMSSSRKEPLLPVKKKKEHATFPHSTKNIGSRGDDEAKKMNTSIVLRTKSDRDIVPYVPSKSSTLKKDNSIPVKNNEVCSSKKDEVNNPKKAPKRNKTTSPKRNESNSTKKDETSKIKEEVRTRSRSKSPKRGAVAAVKASNRSRSRSPHRQQKPWNSNLNNPPSSRKEFSPQTLQKQERQNRPSFQGLSIIEKKTSDNRDK